MTRSAKAASIWCGAPTVWLLLLPFGLLASSSVELQIDAYTGLMLGVNDQHYRPDTVDPALDMGGTFFADFRINRVFSLLTQGNLGYLFGIASARSAVDGATDAASRLPAAERRYQGAQNVSVATQINCVGSFAVGYRNGWYYLPVHIANSALLEDYYGYVDTINYMHWFYYRLEMRHIPFFFYEFDNNFLSTKLSLNFFLDKGRIDSVTNNAVFSADSIIGTVNDFDHRLHTSVLVGGKIRSIGTLVALDAQLVNHIGRAADHDIYNVGLSLSGNGDFLDNRFGYKVRSSLYQQEYLNDPLAEAYVPTGFFQTFYLRNIYSPIDALMVKGLAVLSLGKYVVKQRYELAMRKAWRAHESWIEAGWHSTMGVLFPTTSLYLRAKAQPWKLPEISVYGKSVWNLPTGNSAPLNQTRFLKIGCGTEVSFRFVHGFEVYAAASTEYYHWRMAQGFPPRYSLRLGTRVFLP